MTPPFTRWTSIRARQRAWLRYRTATPSLASGVEGDDNSDGQDVVNTGIESVNNDKQPLSNARYNIAGQKVDDSYKGIVIENGKKRIVK